MALQANDYATIVKLLPYLQRSGTALGSSLGKNASLGQTLSSPGLLSGVGGMLGASLGGKYAPLTSGIGGVGGSLLGSLINKTPINTTSIGGGLGGALGSYLGGNYGKLGSVIGSGLGNIGGQVLTGALFPSSATGVLGGVGSGITGLLTGLLGSSLKGDAAQFANVVSPAVSMLANTYLTPTITSGLSSLLGTGGTTGGAGAGVSTVAGAGGGSLLGSIAGPAAFGLGMIYDAWQANEAKQKAKKKSKVYSAQRNAALAEAAPQFQPLWDAIESEGQKRLEYAKSSGKNAADLGIDPSMGLTKNEIIALYGDTGILSTTPNWENYMSSISSPAVIARHDWDDDPRAATWSQAEQNLMTSTDLDYNKILPWLSSTTEHMTLPSNIDPNTYKFTEAASPISQSIIDQRLNAWQQASNWQKQQEETLRLNGGMW